MVIKAEASAITDPNKTQTCKTQGQKAQISAASCEQTLEQRYERVRERAYYKWEQAGYPEGDGTNFWIEAEAELQSEI